MIILYTHDDDLISAQLFQQKYGGTLVKRPYGSGTYFTSDTMAIIGGQYTNDTYDYWMRQGKLYEIKIENAGLGYVQTFLNGTQRIYALAGWNRIDTITAAALVLENGLPTSNYVNDSPKGIKLVTYEIKYGMSKLVDSMDSIVVQANNMLPTGYKIVYSNIRGNYWDVLYFHNIVWTPITIIITLLIVFGIGLTVYFTADAVTISPEEIAKAYDEMVKTSQEQFNYLVDAGVDPDVAAHAVQETLNKFAEKIPTETDWEKIMKYALYIIIGGASVYAGILTLKYFMEKKK